MVDAKRRAKREASLAAQEVGLDTMKLWHRHPARHRAGAGPAHRPLQKALRLVETLGSTTFPVPKRET